MAYEVKALRTLQCTEHYSVLILHSFSVLYYTVGDCVLLCARGIS